MLGRSVLRLNFDLSEPKESNDAKSPVLDVAGTQQPAANSEPSRRDSGQNASTRTFIQRELTMNDDSPNVHSHVHRGRQSSFRRGTMRCILFCLALCIGGSQGNARASSPHNIVVLVDRSDSISNRPHVQDALINLLLDISRLSHGRVKLAFVFFGGEIKVVADADGLPSPASEPIRQACRDHLSKPCFGGTPLPQALEELNRILAAIPENELKTAVLLGDGNAFLPVSPRLFPEVQAELERLYAAAEKDDDPDALKKLEERLHDYNSETVKSLLALQQPLLDSLCLQLASTTNSYDARIVSLAFEPGLDGLKSIHLAAGGSEHDYIETDSVNVIEAFHNAQIVSGLLHFPTIDIARADSYRFFEDIPLAPELGAETALIVQTSPTAELVKLASLGLQVGSSRHVLGSPTNELSVALDSEGRLATIGVLCPPGTDQARFAFVSPKEQLSFPGAKIFRFTELPDELQFVCRPEAIEEGLPPYEVIQQKLSGFAVGLQFENGNAIPLQGGELIVKHTETGEQRLITLVHDRQHKELWIAPVRDLVVGTYDVIAHLNLSSGVSITTSLDKHFSIIGVEERVRIDVTSASAAVDRIDFGVLGDAVLSHNVAVTVASDTPYDLPLKCRITGLKDSLGTPIGDAWIRSVDDANMVLPAGQETTIEFICSVPEQIADEIADGVIQASLELLNADTLQPVTILPAIPEIACSESLKTVQFTLARPQLLLSAPRAWRDLIQISEDGHQILVVNANVAFPYSRTVKLNLSTTSSQIRQVYVRVGSGRDSENQTSEAATLTLAEAYRGELLTIPAGESITVELPFHVLEAMKRGYGQIVFSGVGLRTKSLAYDVGSTRANGFWLAIIAVTLATYFLWRMFVHTTMIKRLSTFRRTTSSTGRRFSNGQALDLIRFEPCGDKIRLVPLVDDLVIEVGLNEAAPFDREVVVETTDQIAMSTDDGTDIEITGFNPSGTDCWVRINSGGTNERLLKRSVRRRRFANLSFAVLAITAAGVNHWAWVIAPVQYTFDLTGLSAYSTTFKPYSSKEIL